MTDKQSSAARDSPSQSIDWGACLTAHEHWLRKVIYARTGEQQAVDEVFQQMALAAVEQRSPLADIEKAPAWLHRLAVVCAARYRRKLGRGRKAMAAVAEHRRHECNGHAPDLLEWLSGQERQEQTRQALARLAGRDAEVLLLKYGERWSYRQISERLGITEKAVDTRLVRARERLRHELVRRGIEGIEP
ncbi:MAG: RNA polymerase sigma factor [Pirellulaceae bacterium]